MGIRAASTVCVRESGYLREEVLPVVLDGLRHGCGFVVIVANDDQEQPIGLVTDEERDALMVRAWVVSDDVSDGRARAP